MQAALFGFAKSGAHKSWPATCDDRSDCRWRSADHYCDAYSTTNLYCSYFYNFCISSHFLGYSWCLYELTGTNVRSSYQPTIDHLQPSRQFQSLLLRHCPQVSKSSPRAAPSSHELLFISQRRIHHNLNLSAAVQTTLVL